MRRLTLSLARRTVPAPWRRWLNRQLGFCIHYSGPYESWAEARRHAKGYQDPSILEKVTSTSERMARGEIAYEQDSIAFQTPARPDLVLDAIDAASRTALHSPGLKVLDFGGALGALYYRALPYLPPGRIDRWIICEQPHYVRRGKERFERRPVEFVPDATLAVEAGEIDLMILSNVLPYLEDPLGTMRRLAELRPRWILIDRTPLTLAKTSTVAVQHTPRSIYKASYPMWILSRDAVLGALAEYRKSRILELEEPPLTHGTITAPYFGMLLHRKDTCGDGEESLHARR